MTMVSANWAELLTPALRDVFFLGYTQNNRRTSIIPQLFNVIGSQRAYEEWLGVGSMSTQGWNFEDSGRVQYDDFNKGYAQTLYAHEYAKGMAVQRKLVDDNQVARVSFRQSTSMGDAAFRFREKIAASVFINAFTDSGTTAEGFPIAGPDSVGLCSAAHPYSPLDSTAGVNEGTLSLTAANIGATRQLHMALTDDRGDVLNVMPDLILVPPELEDAAIQAIRSTLDPASANNTVNPQAGRFQTIVWHYLTDSNAWFMLDSGLMRQDLIWIDRIPLEFRPPQYDEDTQTAKFISYARWSRGWLDYRFIYGQNPS